MDTKPLQIRLDPALHRALKVAAAERGTTLRALVTTALTRQYGPRSIPPDA